MVVLRQPARRAGLRGVRNEGGAEGSGNADEEERAGTRGVLLRLEVKIRMLGRGEWRGRVHGRGWRVQGVRTECAQCAPCEWRGAWVCDGRGWGSVMGECSEVHMVKE
eukprot:scaffold34874_cov38-Phaeocystis_antarctica.AAC.2